MKPIGALTAEHCEEAAETHRSVDEAILIEHTSARKSILSTIEAHNLKLESPTYQGAI
jgi:hypothetical protein